MKNLLTLLITIFFAPTIIYSQNVAPFQFSDTEKWPIDGKVEQLLLNKNWYAYEMQYFESGNKDINPVRFTLKVANDLTFTQDIYEGDWLIEDDLIIFNLEVSEARPNKQIFTAGAFSIHHISKTELVLAKNLSTNLENRIVYYLTSDKIVKEKLANSNATTPIVSPPQYEIPLTKDELAKKLRMAYFMRKLPAPKKDFSEWTLKELDEEYRELQIK